jgi:glycosyltransferase involved in cell wall biosynthesis
MYHAMDQATIEIGSLEVAHEARLEPTLTPRVSIVVPALNEAENIPHVLPRIPAHYEVVLVDGGSTDGTVAAARACRPDAVIVRQQRRGKGEAIETGVATATGDIIVTLDADGSQRPEEIGLFVEALCAGADFVKGSRTVEGGGSTDFTFTRKVGNAFLGGIANALFGSKYSDITYGYNAFWRSEADRISGGGDGFEGELLMPVRAVQAELRVAEVPCQEDERIHGESNLRPFRDGWLILRMFVRERIENGRRLETEPRGQLAMQSHDLTLVGDIG